MIRSMTGFGRASSEEGSKRSFIIEVKSVNHRFLDVNVRMPKAMIALEERIRNIISQYLNRGKIDLFLNYKNYEKVEGKANLNRELLDSYMGCLNEIKERYSVKDDISLSFISRFPDVIYVEEEEADLEDLWKEIQPLVHSAVKGLVAMREKEGIKLREDIQNNCNNIKKELDKIELKSPKVVEEYKLKLEERIKELIGDAKVDENRLSMEIAIFADKASIAEEITRLNSHIGQLSHTLALEEPIGRKLDFIVQEMNREANTIASKSSDLEITNWILNVKNNIEKIREQVQNIE
ncbi:YicC/YloC family endoribonuclease [Clostridium amazonitimonense]|uniref:YicC/YloC family endoribonuclease n=1 Tax=Clostridium amazonitimonense TaxID=1499689 RepID=UPI000509431E|nr:YicC/YloC family endoribonuclease [Clostridium amazonitimonense]